MDLLEGYTNKKSYYQNEIVNVMINQPMSNYVVLKNILDYNIIINNNLINNWSTNQNISLEINSNLIEVTSNQDGSTPGIKYIETIDVESNSYYTLVIDGYKDCDCQVYPYIKDNNNNKILWRGYNNNLIYTNSNNGLTREIDNKSIFIINIPENTSSLVLLLLFSGPQINDKFFISNITFYKNINNILDDNIDIILEKNYFDLDILNRKNEKLLEYKNILGTTQKHKVGTFAEGCDWDITYSFTIPEYFKSDMYIIKLYDIKSNEFYIPFTVKNNNNRNDILVLSNINTWEAYNDWAGKDGEASLYKWNINDDVNNLINKKYRNTKNESIFVNYNRPNIYNSNRIRKRLNTSYNEYHWDPRVTGEYYLLEWLDINNYNYDIITDQDLHNYPDILNNYKTFIIHNHCEYWSEEMLQGLYKYIKNYGNLMYLGGNGLYWKTTIKNNQLEVRKSGDYHIHTDEKGGLWSELQNEIFPLPIPEKITGLKFYGKAWPVLGNTLYGGYRITNSNHWIFDGVNQDFIGNDGLNGTIIKHGASGWEYDGVVDPNLEDNIIGKGYINNKIYNGNDMIYFENGGKIFSSGSVTYTGSLLIDENISKITMNVLNNFLE